jgi:hypothetical protein
VFDATIDDDSCEYYEFDVTIDPTGESHLVILLDSVTGLDVGDEVGIFDANGVIESCIPGGCDPASDMQYGEVLVGAGMWDGESNNQGTAMQVSAIMSIDLSDFNGPILNGAIDGNDVVVKVYDASEGVILDTELTIDIGGEFGDLFTIISELELFLPEPVYGCTDSDACNYKQAREGIALILK